MYYNTNLSYYSTKVLYKFIQEKLQFCIFLRILEYKETIMSQHIYTKTSVDTETGETKQVEFLVRKQLNKEQFVRAYIEDLGALAKCSGAEQSVILCSMKYLDYNTNELFINKQRREEIVECGSLKLNTINSAIARLIKKNILIKKGSSSYILNPKLFFFGTDLERYKLFKLSISYEIREDCK